jgi:hypothetical protein
LLQLFSDNLAGVLNFLILQDKQNISKRYIVVQYQINLHSWRNTESEARKACPQLVFPPVSKAHTNKLYIFGQCTYIVPGIYIRQLPTVTSFIKVIGANKGVFKTLSFTKECYI